MTEIDKILSTLQTIAWVWMCMRYLVSPFLHFMLDRANRGEEHMIEEDDDIQDYKKPWVGLTDAETAECFEAKVISDRLKADAKRIEAKLREKNST